MKLFSPFKRFNKWYFSSQSLEKEFEIDQVLAIKSFELVTLINSIISFISGALFWYIFKDNLIFFSCSVLSLSSFCWPFISRKYKYHRIFPNIFLISIFLFVLIMSSRVGGYHGPIANWLLLLPVVAALICHKRMILVWGTVSIIATAVLYWASKNQLIEHGPFLLSPQSLDGRFLNGIQAIIAMTLMGWAFKKVSEESIQLLKMGRNRYQNLLRLVVHDISTPLSIIKINGNKAEKNYPDSKDVSRMNQAVTLLSQMIDEVRHLSMLESGKLCLKSNPVCPHEVLETIEFLFDEKLKAKNITLITEVIKSEDSLILGDKSILVNQVLANLMSNAIKFSYPDSKIAIRVEEIFDRIEFSIKDSGTGITKELLSEIFDPIKHTSHRGTQGEKGTGYGLPLVKAFTESMNGTIRVESLNVNDSPDTHGSLFTISFPRVLSSKADQNKAA